MPKEPGAATESPHGDRFRVRKFTDEAADVIRQQILGREIQPGDRLNEVALARELQISRAPIREALNALAGEGLVQFVPGRGAFVPELSVAKVDNLGEVRQALECLGARLAVERATEAQLGDLERLIERTETCLRDEPESYPSDLDFHLQLLTASGNPELVQTATAVISQLRLARVWSGKAPGRAVQACNEHRSIHRALLDRDGDAAEAAMRRHLEAAATSARELLARTDGDAPAMT